MIDPTGRLVVLIRDNAAVAAITPRVRGGEKAQGDAAPYVVIRRLSSVPWIGDPGTESAAVQTVRYTVLCYAPKVQGGDRQAFALAGAVHDAIHDIGPFLFPAPGGGGSAAMWSVMEDNTGPALIDPVSGEPYVPVQLSLLASAQPVAA